MRNMGWWLVASCCMSHIYTLQASTFLRVFFCYRDSSHWFVHLPLFCRAPWTRRASHGTTVKRKCGAHLVFLTVCGCVAITHFSFQPASPSSTDLVFSIMHLSQTLPNCTLQKESDNISQTGAPGLTLLSAIFSAYIIKKWQPQWSQFSAWLAFLFNLFPVWL